MLMKRAVPIQAEIAANMPTSGTNMRIPAATTEAKMTGKTTVRVRLVFGGSSSMEDNRSGDPTNPKPKDSTIHNVARSFSPRPRCFLSSSSSLSSSLSWDEERG